MNNSYDPTNNFQNIAKICDALMEKHNITFDQALEVMRLALQMRPQ